MCFSNVRTANRIGGSWSSPSQQAIPGPSWIGLQHRVRVSVCRKNAPQGMSFAATAAMLKIRFRMREGIMKGRLWGAIGTVTMIGLVGCTRAERAVLLGQPAPDDVTELVRGWPATPRDVANQMIARYGNPHEATTTMLVWHNNGPWKRTVLYRDEVPHDFPKSHTDVLEQFIDYRVPVDKFDEIAAYDGSVITERTKGEVSARCDKEEMNYLALNLANDVATGKRTVEDARRFYAQTAMAFMNGERPPYTQGLQFTVQRGGTADRDRPAGTGN
jgi:hypothetical protein